MLELDLTKKQVFSKRLIEKHLRSFALSPDGSKIVSKTGETIKIWSTNTGECLLTIRGIIDNVISVAWSPDGTKIVSGFRVNTTKTMKIWSTIDGKCLKTIHHQRYASISILFAWSPDGTNIVSVYLDRTIRVWSVDNGECLLTLRGHTSIIMSLAWSPDSSKIVSGSRDKTIKIWSVTNGKCLKTIEGYTGHLMSYGRLMSDGHSESINCVAWSPDGTKIASASDDATIKIWSVMDGKCLKTLRGSETKVCTVAWSPDGTKIVSGSRWIFVKIWSVMDGKCLKTLKGHTRAITSVAWFPDGSKIISASNDGTIRVWSLEMLRYPYILPILDNIEKLKTTYPDGNPLTTDGPDGEQTYQTYKISFDRIRIHDNAFDINFYAKVYYNDYIGFHKLHLTATDVKKDNMMFLLQMCPYNYFQEEEDECEPSSIQVRTADIQVRTTEKVRTTFNHLFHMLINGEIRFIDQPVTPTNGPVSKKRKRLKNNIILRF